MISSITGSLPSPTADAHLRRGRNASEYQGHTFGRHLQAAALETDDSSGTAMGAQQPVSVAGTDSGRNSATPARGAESGSASAATAFIVNYNAAARPAASNTAAGGTAQSSAPADATSADSGSDGSSATTALDAAVSALNTALQKAGIDPSRVKINAHDDEVWYPGGSYTNDLLTVTANGKSYDFDASLTLEAPNVTVTDVQHALDGTWS